MKERFLWIARDSNGAVYHVGLTCMRKCTYDADKSKFYWETDWDNTVLEYESFCSEIFHKLTPKSVHLRAGRQIKVKITATGWERV